MHPAERNAVSRVLRAALPPAGEDVGNDKGRSHGPPVIPNRQSLQTYLQYARNLMHQCVGAPCCARCRAFVFIGLYHLP
jgi:hypothetical protein